MGGAIEEQLRPPRIVRVAIIQNSIVLPTTEPIREQRDAIYKKITKYIEHAASCGANIVCMQEGWREYNSIVALNCAIEVVCLLEWLPSDQAIDGENVWENLKFESW